MLEILSRLSTLIGIFHEKKNAVIRPRPAPHHAKKRVNPSMPGAHPKQGASDHGHPPPHSQPHPHAPHHPEAKQAPGHPLKRKGEGHHGPREGMSNAPHAAHETYNHAVHGKTAAVHSFSTKEPYAEGSGTPQASSSTMASSQENHIPPTEPGLSGEWAEAQKKGEGDGTTSSGSASGGGGDVMLPARIPDKDGAGRAPSARMRGRLRPELEGTRIIFKGVVLTAPGGPLKVAPESRNLCALFDSGMWLVSASHRNSPLVTSVAAQARRQNLPIEEPRYVTPDIIQQAYFYSSKMATLREYDENSIRRMITRILEQAQAAGANDIHIETSQKGRTKVEFRVDGALQLAETLTQREGEQLLSSIWSHASTQSGVTANWLEPQSAMLAPGSGTDQIILPEGISGVRCQWLPLADQSSVGRYLVMRLHRHNLSLAGIKDINMDVDALGFSPEQMATIRYLRSLTSGMFVNAAPVNQGKTTTLSVMLNQVMVQTKYTKNCLVIEDPPEVTIPGVRNIGVRVLQDSGKRQEIFDNIIRSALRSDPDILMLGELRDSQTVKFAFQAAQTGIPIYTTCHVTSALPIPKRLRDLGVEPYLVYDHTLLRGLMSQRLIRKLCPYCHIPLSKAAADNPDVLQKTIRLRTAIALMNIEKTKHLPEQEAKVGFREPDLSETYIPNDIGCEHCDHGRLGRTVVAEVIEADAKLMRLLSENRIDEAQEYWLSPEGLGGTSMLWHALDKMQKGIISPSDAEMELGPLASEKEINYINKKIGAFQGWQS